MFFEQVEAIIKEAVEAEIAGSRRARLDYVTYGRYILTILFFADDVAILARTEHGMKVIMEAM